MYQGNLNQRRPTGEDTPQSSTLGYSFYPEVSPNFGYEYGDFIPQIPNPQRNQEQPHRIVRASREQIVVETQQNNFHNHSATGMNVPNLPLSYQQGMAVCSQNPAFEQFEVQASMIPLSYQPAAASEHTFDGRDGTINPNFRGANYSRSMSDPQGRCDYNGDSGHFAPAPNMPRHHPPVSDFQPRWTREFQNTPSSQSIAPQINESEEEGDDDSQVAKTETPQEAKISSLVGKWTVQGDQFEKAGGNAVPPVYKGLIKSAQHLHNIRMGLLKPGKPDLGSVDEGGPLTENDHTLLPLVKKLYNAVVNTVDLIDQYQANGRMSVPVVFLLSIEPLYIELNCWDRVILCMQKHDVGFVDNRMFINPKKKKSHEREEFDTWQERLEAFTMYCKRSKAFCKKFLAPDTGDRLFECPNKEFLAVLSSIGSNDKKKTAQDAGKAAMKLLGESDKKKRKASDVDQQDQLKHETVKLPSAKRHKAERYRTTQSESEDTSRYSSSSSSGKTPISKAKKSSARPASTSLNNRGNHGDPDAPLQARYVESMHDGNKAQLPESSALLSLDFIGEVPNPHGFEGQPNFSDFDTYQGTETPFADENIQPNNGASLWVEENQLDLPYLFPMNPAEPVPEQQSILDQVQDL